MIHPIRPEPARLICIGTAVFISFSTPDKDVKVEDPVKFIAIKEDRPPIIRNQEIISTGELPRVPVNNRMTAASHPISKPFRENLWKGIQGNSNGVMAHPVR